MPADLIDHILDWPILQMVRRTTNNIDVPGSVVTHAQTRGLLTKPITPAGIARSPVSTANMSRLGSHGGKDCTKVMAISKGMEQRR
jgi:hypothetical protein